MCRSPAQACLFLHCLRESAVLLEVEGSAGQDGSCADQLKAAVRSLVTARRQGEMFGQLTLNRFPMNWIVLVWSDTSECTARRRLHYGEPVRAERQSQ